MCASCELLFGHSKLLRKHRISENTRRAKMKMNESKRKKGKYTKIIELKWNIRTDERLVFVKWKSMKGIVFYLSDYIFYIRTHKHSYTRAFISIIFAWRNTMENPYRRCEFRFHFEHPFYRSKTSKQSKRIRRIFPFLLSCRYFDVYSLKMKWPKASNSQLHWSQKMHTKTRASKWRANAKNGSKTDSNQYSGNIMNLMHILTHAYSLSIQL